MKDFVLNTMPYLEQYHQRSNSESGFTADKEMPGWNVAQKREKEIDNALFCTGMWYNLFSMGRFKNCVPYSENLVSSFKGKINEITNIVFLLSQI